MQRIRIRELVFITVLAALPCVFVYGQTARPVPDSDGAFSQKVIPPAHRMKPYFSQDDDPARPHTIEFRTVDQMTQADRLQAANAESSIAENTRYADLEFNQGQWTYQQVVCPALPGHIFLRFSRNSGDGDVSMFSASIPRGGEGRVRIIPIQLRGYSLFSPAPINSLTISAFNHIRAEEDPDKDADWLGTVLCYAALAGGHPQAAALSDNPETQKYPTASVATLRVGMDGGAELSFTDINTGSRPMRWSMTFDSKGKLVKGGHEPAELMPIEIFHPLPVDVVGKPIPMTEPKSRTYNPPAPAVVKQIPQLPPPPQKQIPAPPSPSTN
jgi:hypothetical protein